MFGVGLVFGALLGMALTALTFAVYDNATWVFDYIGERIGRK